MATSGKILERSKPSLPKELPLDFLKKITNDFSKERQLGTGAFGSTYKGILEDGEVVAVKRLGENLPVPRDKIFEDEFQNIMVLEHENIVKLVAYSREAQNKLVQSSNRYIVAQITETVLCYEYLSKGSLDKHIFGESTSVDWNTRFNIIKGISRGIQFLHNLPKPILHLRLKPQKILLDDNMVPKIVDLLFSNDMDLEDPYYGERWPHSQTGGGYMAPEYLYHGEFSARSDIYSLGLIILEITTREKNNSSTDQKHARNYIEGVTKNWTLEKIMEEYPELEENDMSQVENCIRIGLQCVEINQERRPTINEIVSKLN